MTKNIGASDRVIRILIAIMIGILYFTGRIIGTSAIILDIIAIMFLLTGCIGRCPLYASLRISTVKKKERKRASRPM